MYFHIHTLRTIFASSLNADTMKQNTKDWIQYGSAVALIASAIAVAVMSVTITMDVAGGTNTYIGIAISGALAIFGITTFAITQIASFKQQLLNEEKKGKEERNGD